ncbi:MAG: hypothetical protein HN576_10505 [Bacteriovoracaceae bacterium]|jgi:hypothetical protein|nr:hypothetical protein [Bacteriovoracaceae bacterium]
MYMAIAVDTSKHPSKKSQYKIWYLELNTRGDVVAIGVKSRQEMIKNLLEYFRKHGTSNWRAFQKDQEQSTPIEMLDFISQNVHENTHFGNLPVLSEFQETLKCLSMNLELRAIA